MTTRTAPRAAAPAWVTLFNPISKRLLAAHVPLGPNALVTVRGRNSGEPRATPLAIIQASDRRWIWSPWGDVNWVRNLRAAGRATVSVRGRAEEVEATELDAAERIVFFRDVLAGVARGIPFGFTFVRLVDGVDLHHPEEAAAGRRVFELKRAA